MPDYNAINSKHTELARANVYVLEHIILAELHDDLFSRHARPLEGYVFVVVDDRGKDVLSDEIRRRCNGKQQRRRRGGRSVQPPDCL